MEPTTHAPDRSRPARLAVHGAVSGELALLSDRKLRQLVDAAPPLGDGIGGRAALLEVDGTPVFVKRVPLTDLELRPEHRHSTANLFQLPVICQYGIGGPGFGAWRELAVHRLTTGWVLGGEYEGFPLMYHWRVLPDVPQPLPEELADVDAAVAYWEGSPAVRERIEALAEASSSLVLFLEYLPETLRGWLTGRLAEGGEAAEAACTLVDRELAAGTGFMNSRGLLHFDAHFANVLTDGERLYFTDFGLAVHERFELTEAEAAFFREHRRYDRCYTETALALCLATTVHGLREPERSATVRAWARGTPPTGGPAAATEIITRYAPVAAVMGEFRRQLEHVSRSTAYPAGDVPEHYHQR
ncbi:protein kinase family protein [Streptacidiphilus sp. P02-A3a]|uniref:protein kinase family protein n=1 Tax=Streptacidiphilus sp. P02-A3a TaxID=2704468 RepID=UPI0015F9230F|nr:protein kinase family protein [Streptacidiphilus sp. P02-A3a]QMU67152.1 protein kinase family protein [Streptacidiphilus sp. P02-A3a]